MASTAARSQALSLYRNLLREARVFKDYNFREYAGRRARAGFRENQNLEAGSDAAKAALADGQTQLEIVRRQALINSMYTHTSSVMEAQRTHPAAK